MARATHTADGFNDSEWTAFWRENGKQVTNYTSIFSKTLRSREFADYGSFVVESLGSKYFDLAPKGTFKVRVMDSSSVPHTSHEPPAVKLAMGWSGADAMLKALQVYAPAW